MWLRTLISLLLIAALFFFIDYCFVTYEYVPNIVHVYNGGGSKDISFVYNDTFLVNQASEVWDDARDANLDPIDKVSTLPFVHILTNEVYAVLQDHVTTNVIVSYRAEHNSKIRNRHVHFFDVELGGKVNDRCWCGHTIWVKELSRFKQITTEALVYCEKCERYVLVPHTSILCQ